jgi:hypothetical protein
MVGLCADIKRKEVPMIEKLPESEGPALGVRITGKVSLEMEKEWIRLQ